MKLRNFLGIFFLLGLALVGAPIFWVETSCVAPQASAAPQTKTAGASFLIYPEWYVIDAYGDLAGVAKQSSESAFDYGASIGGFWNSLCATTEAASRSGPIAIDRKATNYLAGYVFTMEMALKGVWERTIGAATLWIRGPVRTSEDQFGVATLEDYAAFLKKSPGGVYPFSAEFDRFWKETPSDGESKPRKWERRTLFFMEYNLRGLYGHPGILKPRPATAQKGDGTAAPRMAPHAPAGASRVLTTVLAPPDKKVDFGGAREIFAFAVQSKPGWKRIGLDTDASALVAQPALVEGQGAIFERAYE